MRLTAEQQAYVLEISRPCIAIAIPGSGKSTTLVAKMVHILRSDENNRVCAISFTRKAAQELKSKVASKCTKDESQRVIVGTFHSIALQMIRALAKTIQRPPPRLIGEVQAHRYLKRAAACIGVPMEDDFVQAFNALRATCERYERPSPSERPVQAILADRTAAKNAAEGGKVDISTERESTAREVARQLAREFDKLCIQDGVIDFARVLRVVVNELTNGLGRLAPLDVTHMLVDEAQDLDAAQQAAVMAHAMLGVVVDLVADDDQAIYAFRWSQGVTGLRNFMAGTQAVEFQLSTNFRCAPAILGLADELIQGNAHDRIPKRLIAEKQDKAYISEMVFQTRADEVSGLSKLCAQALEAMGSKGVGILSRASKPLAMMEASLTTHEVPYKRQGGESFWEMAPVDLYLSALTAVASNSDSGLTVALSHAGVPEETIAALKRLGGNSVGRALEGPEEPVMALLSDCGKAAEVMGGLAKNFKRWRREARIYSTSIRRPAAGAESGADDEEGPSTSPHLEQPAPGPGRVAVEVGEWMLECLACSGEKVTDWHMQALQMATETMLSFDGNLHARIGRTRSFDRTEDDDEEPTVSLLTMHASKGLEFETVFVMALEDGVIPHKSLATSEEEERRLMYVAITRAKTVLVLSRSEKGKGGSSIPRSPLLHEITGLGQYQGLLQAPWLTK